MRKIWKNVITVLTAGVLAVGAASLAACGYSHSPLDGNTEGTVVSNGGFVVEKGEYVYFINGLESSTADNTYGTPVKGALMRIPKSEVKAGNGEEAAETVIPSLMVSGDTEAGIFIYGDRVYYATPNSDKDISGNVANTFLDFKSARLDGSDVKDYFYYSDSAVTYRYVQVEDKVYLLYVDGSDLHSYNTTDGTDTVLVKAGGTYYFYDGSEQNAKENPYVYYTMTVTADIDVVDGSVTRGYNQIYRVRADATSAPEGYDYEWSQEYLDAHDGEAPYVNLGEIVLDGIGAVNMKDPQRFTHEKKDDTGALTAENKPATAGGYSYTIQSYTNGGIYFTRSNVESKTDSHGEDGWLYYLAQEKIKIGSGWNSITSNASGVLDVIAQGTTQASGSALYYTENGKQYYLFAEDTSLFRAEVGENGNAELTRIAIGAGSVTLSRLDEEHHYLYYTNSGSIYRLVYNGNEEDYKTLNDKTEYQAAQILKISHASSWYDFELIDGILYFSDAESLGGTYNYLSAVNLKNESGELMTNTELADYNKKYSEAIGDDSYYQELQDESKSDLANAVRYYFYAGNTEAFDENVKEAEEKTGKEYTLYSEEETETFRKFVDGGLEEQNGKKPVLRSDFITRIGKWTDADKNALNTYFKTSVLKSYTEPASSGSEGSGLPAWGWALIAIAIGLVVIGVGVLAYFMLRARKGKESTPGKKEFVDTTDDRNIDVYADRESEGESVGKPLEEPAESGEPAEAPEEEAEEESEEAPGAPGIDGEEDPADPTE